MLYAILVYQSDVLIEADADGRWSELRTFQETGKLRGAVRLLPTTSAVSVRQGAQGPVVLDGSVSDLPRDLLQAFILEAESLAEAIDSVERFSRTSRWCDIEIRPIAGMWIDRLDRIE